MKTKQNRIYSHDEIIKSAQNMEKWGGSFVRLLGKALIVADNKNKAKLLHVFSDYVDEYLNNF